MNLGLGREKLSDKLSDIQMLWDMQASSRMLSRNPSRRDLSAAVSVSEESDDAVSRSQEAGAGPRKPKGAKPGPSQDSPQPRRLAFDLTEEDVKVGNLEGNPRTLLGSPAGSRSPSRVPSRSDSKRNVRINPMEISPEELPGAAYAASKAALGGLLGGKGANSPSSSPSGSRAGSRSVSRSDSRRSLRPSNPTLDPSLDPTSDPNPGSLVSSPSESRSVSRSISRTISRSASRSSSRRNIKFEAASDPSIDASEPASELASGAFEAASAALEAASHPENLLASSNDAADQKSADEKVAPSPAGFEPAPEALRVFARTAFSKGTNAAADGGGVGDGDGGGVDGGGGLGQGEERSDALENPSKPARGGLGRALNWQQSFKRGPDRGGSRRNLAEGFNAAASDAAAAGGASVDGTSGERGGVPGQGNEPGNTLEDPGGATRSGLGRAMNFQKSFKKGPERGASRRNLVDGSNAAAADAAAGGVVLGDSGGVGSDNLGSGFEAGQTLGRSANWRQSFMGESSLDSETSLSRSAVFGGTQRSYVDAADDLNAL